jgi:Putative serine esterase (DUF676)
LRELRSHRLAERFRSDLRSGFESQYILLGRTSIQQEVLSNVLSANVRHTWVIDIVSQAIFANAPTTYTITLGHTKESTRKAAQANEIITSSPGLTIQKLATAELWTMPPIFPEHKNVHLVILTHGLHSNVTADMFYLKERIEQVAGLAQRPDGGVVVRGYCGNVCKTERGIKWLGKRMARWLLKETLWLEQVGCFAPDAPPYSRISFIGHSLGGVVQNFAIAMVELMTNGDFFRKLRPVNLITLAAPWLGVSAESPSYVKLALDVGLVGRTGQDLGLMHRLGHKSDNISESTQIRDSRPILRLLALPTSPAHRVIRRFCTRTIYANVVNDGIVPLRTSAMFFLDWNSLDAVEKTVMPNGVLGGIVGLPTLDDLMDGVERIFARKSISEEASALNEHSSNETPAGEESASRSQSFIPSFLRRRSTNMVFMSHFLSEKKVSDEQRRRTLPPIKTNSAELKRDVASAMEDDLSGKSSSDGDNNSDPEEKELEKQFGMQNEEHVKKDDQDGESKSEELGKQPETEQLEAQANHPDDTELSRTSPGVYAKRQKRPSESETEINPKPCSEQDTIQHPDSDMSASNHAGQENLETVVSDIITQSPTETNNPINRRPSLTRQNEPPNKPATDSPNDEDQSQGDTTNNPLTSLIQHFRSATGKHPVPRRLSKVYHRSQTISTFPTDIRSPPPRTSFLESFPSLINPPIPDEKFITQPSCRAKTIFHDRLYTPDDIPPVPASSSVDTNESDEQITKREKLRLEEKIARDWHCDMTWRKVLVKLEPDAHNNIFVRRMFPNAYGWPVIEHLVHEHFASDPPGLESEFIQEIGVIPLDEGDASPTWESPMMDLESDDELEKSGISDRPESIGRAMMSDEESGNILEMTEFPARSDHNESNGAT